ncbi:MAG: thermonuclease family protein [Alphaproteobacteria bacterium]|nr:thermonuclease family protein [Alphaproteobacteria bacterium]
MHKFLRVVKYLLKEMLIYVERGSFKYKNDNLRVRVRFGFSASKSISCENVMLRFLSRARLAFYIVPVYGILALGLLPISQAEAQNQAEEKPVRINARAVDGRTLVSGNFKIRLWGIETVDTDQPVFALTARNALDEQIDGHPVECTIKSRAENQIVAQCVNDVEEDLSLFMLSQGFAVVERQLVYGSPFEKPYIEAETRAQSEGKGLWALGGQGSSHSGGNDDSRTFLIGGFVLVGILLTALVAITLFIMKGFRAVVDVQNQSMDLVTKERVLREKEKLIIASMINAEVKTNKSKIEAYLMMYEELLKDLKDKNREPKYKKSGDIIQRQPALSRAVFDGNTAKLDLLGQNTSSEVIHYYARIKTVPDYYELEPDAPVSQAISVVEAAVEGAKKLDIISDKILDKFASMLLVQES